MQLDTRWFRFIGGGILIISSVLNFYLMVKYAKHSDPLKDPSGKLSCFNFLFGVALFLSGGFSYAGTVLSANTHPVVGRIGGLIQLAIGILGIIVIQISNSSIPKSFSLKLIKFSFLLIVISGVITLISNIDSWLNLISNLRAIGLVCGLFLLIHSVFGFYYVYKHPNEELGTFAWTFLSFVLFLAGVLSIAGVTLSLTNQPVLIIIGGLIQLTIGIAGCVVILLVSSGRGFDNYFALYLLLCFVLLVVSGALPLTSNISV